MSSSSFQKKASRFIKRRKRLFHQYTDKNLVSHPLYNTGSGFHHRLMLGRLQRPNVVLVDAGANQGMFSLLLFDLFKEFSPRVVSIECQRQLLGKLEEKLKEYGPSSLLISSALTGEATEDKIVFTELVGKRRGDGPPAYNEWGTINQDKEIPSDAEVSRYEVEQLTLDELLKNNSISYIDYLKMDIEGAEEAVLEKMTVETASKIGQWSMEYHRDDPSDLIVKLESLGFRTKVFKGDHEIFAYRP